jgi:hypothetical protein
LIFSRTKPQALILDSTSFLENYQMALLSAAAVKSVAIALANKPAAEELCVAANNGDALGRASGMAVVACIIATNVSQTVDFAALAVGDQVLMIPAVAGSSVRITIATAGNLGQAAVVGNAYLVLRAFAVPSAANTVAVF